MGKLGEISFRQFWNSCGWYLLIIISLIILFYIWKFETSEDYDGSYSKDFNKMDINARNKSKKKVPRMSTGEKTCREYLENLFQKPFPSVRPDFLFNDATGENLELDMYNRSELLACEYNGKQHYEYIPYLHKNNKLNFIYQQYRDNLKKEVCEKLGIRLITVPYTIPNEQIPMFIQSELMKFGYKFK